MSHAPLSSQQMAEAVKEHGGGSFNWHTGVPASGPGFMVAKEGAETTIHGDLTGEAIDKFKADHAAQVGSDPSAHSGFWGNNPSVADVSMKLETGREARSVGGANAQEAAFALPGTKINAKGQKIEDVANEWGGDVLLNTKDIGKNDADKRFRPARSNDHFSLNEVENPEWNKVGGTMGGKDVTYGDVLRQINKGRTERKRGGK